MDLGAARDVHSLGEGPAAIQNLAAVKEREPGKERAAKDAFAIVKVVSALTGSEICSFQAQSVPDLKARIEEATGVHSFDQCLVLNSTMLVEGYPIAQASAGAPVVVGLLQRATIAGAVGRAIMCLRAGDTRDFAEQFANDICRHGVLCETLDKRLAGLCVQDVNEMEQVAFLLLESVLLEHALAEGCAAIVHTLRKRFADTFSRTFLNMCEVEFEKCLLAVAGMDTAESEESKTRMLSMAMFIGYLFCRRILPVKIVAQVMYDFIGGPESGEQNPRDSFVECACELLRIAGGDLDHTRMGEALVTDVVNRLSELKEKSDPVSGEPVYPESLTAYVQMTVDVSSRESLW